MKEKRRKEKEDEIIGYKLEWRRGLIE